MNTLDKQVKQYILNNIDNSGYSDEELKTDKDKILFLKQTFYSEYGWNVTREGEHKALMEWYQGLPSSIAIDFYHWDIIKLAIEWGTLSENATEKQESKIIDNWFNLLAVKTGQLFRTIEPK